MEIYLDKRFNFKDFDVEYFVPRIKQILPFFLLSIFIQVYMHMDKIILEYFSKTFELGIYDQILKLNFAIVAPLTALGTILMPYFSNNISNKPNTNKDISHLTLSANFIMIITVGMFFGYQGILSDLINILFGSQYQAYKLTFNIAGMLILTAGLYNFVIQQILFPNNKEKVYLFGVLVVSIIKVVLLFIFIPKFGLISVVSIYFFSECIILTFCIFSVKNTINFKFILKEIEVFKILISGFIMFLILNLLNLHIVIEIFIGIFYFLFNLIIFKEKIISNLIRKIFTG